MSRNSVSLFAAAFGLTLSTVGPAGATVRIATYTWTPAAGPVAGYALYASVDGGAEFLYGYVDASSAVVEVDSGASLSLSIAAFDATGRLGPRSDPSPPLRLCPGDFDGDELIALTDAMRVKSCFGLLASEPCAFADMNDDGVIGIADWGAIELGANACASFDSADFSAAPDSLAAADTLTSCAGDMDGDGSVTSQDLEAARACLGLMALGNCAAADLDGSGYITRDDTSIIRQAVEEETCP